MRMSCTRGIGSDMELSATQYALMLAHAWAAYEDGGDPECIIAAALAKGDIKIEGGGIIGFTYPDPTTHERIKV